MNTHFLRGLCRPTLFLALIFFSTLAPAGQDTSRLAGFVERGMELWRVPGMAVTVVSSEEVLFQISAHAYSYGRFRRLLREAGFQIESCRGHGYVNFEIIGRRIGRRGELFLHRFFSAVARVLPIGRWANDLIVVARK